ncbi:MAG: hypothetical protein ACUVT1_04260 [Anaerolineae bacterium]
MRTLVKVLYDFDDVHLRAIAWLRGVEVGEASRQELVNQLAEALLQPDSIHQALRGMTPEERKALADLQRAGGVLRAHVFLHRYGPIRRFGPGKLEREKPWLAPAGPAEMLWYKGFIGRGFAQMGEDMVEAIFIPSDLLPLLPDLADARSGGMFPEPLAEPPAGMRCLANAGLMDVLAILLFIQLHHPKPGDNSPVAESEAQRLAGWLTQPHLPLSRTRLALLLRLSQELGLYQVKEGRLTLHPQTSRQWLKLPRAHQLRSLLETWRESSEWNDLWHVPGLQCEPTSWSNDPRATRQRFLTHLRGLTAGSWYRIAGLVEHLHAEDPDFQRPDGDYQSWYIRDTAKGELLRGFETWDRVEGALIRFYLTGPLFWLSAVELGQDEAGNPVCFRLTDAGARFIAGAAEPEHTLPAPAVRLHEGLVLEMDADSPLYYALQLARFADRQGDTWQFRITPASLLTARQQGINLGAIQHFIEHATGRPLQPEEKEKLAQAWEAGVRVHMARWLALEFADAEVVQWLRERLPALFAPAVELAPAKVLLPEAQARRLAREAKSLGIPFTFTT